jgi:hypothetical protein
VCVCVFILGLSSNSPSTSSACPNIFTTTEPHYIYYCIPFIITTVYHLYLLLHTINIYYCISLIFTTVYHLYLLLYTIYFYYFIPCIFSTVPALGIGVIGQQPQNIIGILSNAACMALRCVGMS